MNESIYNYFSGELTESQKIELFRQLSADPEAQKEFAAIQNIVALAGLSPSEHDAEIAGKYLDDFRKKHKRKALQTFFISFSKYAAIIAVIAAVYYYTFSVHKTEHTRDAVANNYLTVPAGQRVKLTLSDGTTVWLNSRSTLSYPGLFTGNTREVILEGEAYFDVAHDEKKMFIVKTQQFDIRVFGTEFNVKAYTDNPLSEVSLLKGSVEVKPAGDFQTYRMKENEKISFREKRIIGKTPDEKPENTENENSGKDAPGIEPGNNYLVLPIQNYDYFKWKDGIINFDNETVEDILKELELYYDIRIEVKKPALLKLRYSGKFRSKDGIEQVFKVLQLEHKFSYTRDNEKNLITIK